ncbi:hypothetical protein AX774_g2807 [Zancudomyces culisetae]|uniref:Uncharacterized protein n=1 Tax=Zancudomyces culisetae TaxID=1213189 RepID=A0A1R1PRS1_ZANCU|nr:hypothetical protein AX774_g2807 [Zancudomyces culisetae]|eukprot:OMH83680.1 hypothetical protein AX774_g2807 [Zancudomyces culisetae]
MEVLRETNRGGKGQDVISRVVQDMDKTTEHSRGQSKRGVGGSGVLRPGNFDEKQLIHRLRGHKKGILTSVKDKKEYTTEHKLIIAIRHLREAVSAGGDKRIVRKRRRVGDNSYGYSYDYSEGVEGENRDDDGRFYYYYLFMAYLAMEDYDSIVQEGIKVCKKANEQQQHIWEAGLVGMDDEVPLYKLKYAAIVIVTGMVKADEEKKEKMYQECLYEYLKRDKYADFMTYVLPYMKMGTQKQEDIKDEEEDSDYNVSKRITRQATRAKERGVDNDGKPLVGRVAMYQTKEWKNWCQGTDGH